MQRRVIFSQRSLSISHSFFYNFHWSSAGIFSQETWQTLTFYRSQTKRQTFIVLLNDTKYHVKKVLYFRYCTFAEVLQYEHWNHDRSFFLWWRAAPANICAIINRLRDASGFDISINSQIGTCLSEHGRETSVSYLQFIFLSLEVRLRTNYAYFTTPKGIVAAGIGLFATTRCH